MAGPVIDDELQGEIEAIAHSVECELYHLRYANNRLQIFLDREDGGVTIDHCQAVSRQVSALLDVHDFGSKRYHLEVGSPGLDRELFRRRDFERFLGSLARVTFTNGDGNKQTIVGRLEAYDVGGDEETSDDDKSGAVRLLESENDVVHRIPHDSIRLARLEIEL